MDKILIKDLLLRGIVGINDWERTKRQDILLNLIIYHDLKKSGKTDDIDDTLNYRTITKDIIDYVESSDHFLVEALAHEIAKICIIKYAAKKVTIRIEKPGALRFADSVGVEITRKVDDFE